MSNSTIAFRLSSEEIAALDRVAAKRSCSRSEAARTALMFGIRFAEAEHTFNITRAVLVLEYMQAAIDVMLGVEFTLTKLITTVVEAIQEARGAGLRAALRPRRPP